MMFRLIAVSGKEQPLMSGFVQRERGYAATGNCFAPRKVFECRDGCDFGAADNSERSIGWIDGHIECAKL